MIGWAGFNGTGTPSTTPLQKNKMLIYGLCSNSDDRLGWSAKKINAHFFEPHLPPLSSQKNEMLIFGLHSNSDDWLGWSMDTKPHLPSLSNQK